MKHILKIMLGFIFCFLNCILFNNIITYSYIIGLDEKGIYAFSDDLETINNEWLILDLDFDGRNEYYYFDKTGLLLTNEAVANSNVNILGQKYNESGVEIINSTPFNKEILQVDNLDYYYINSVSQAYNKSWDISNDLICRVSIALPHIVGTDKNIVNTVNSILNDRCKELLMIYLRDNVYKTRTKRCTISIERFMRNGTHTLNFLKDSLNRFYFRFNIVTLLENKIEHKSNLGIVVDPINSICEIANFDLKFLNNLKYNEQEFVKSEQIKNNIQISSQSIIPYKYRFFDIIGELRNDYIDSLNEYLDNAEESIAEYESRESIDKKKKISFIEQYIKNINNIYTHHLSIAKKLKRENQIDEETYSLYEKEMKNLLDKYKNTIEKNLMVDINALKEQLINENKTK